MGVSFKLNDHFPLTATLIATQRKMILTIFDVLHFASLFVRRANASRGGNTPHVLLQVSHNAGLAHHIGLRQLTLPSQPNGGQSRRWVHLRHQLASSWHA